MNRSGVAFAYVVDTRTGKTSEKDRVTSVRTSRKKKVHSGKGGFLSVIYLG